MLRIHDDKGGKMADGYEIFDTGHGSMKGIHYRLNAKEIDQVMRAVRALRLSSAAEARQMLLKGSGVMSRPSQNSTTSNSAGSSTTWRGKGASDGQLASSDEQAASTDSCASTHFGVSKA
jgi:hypothetical protein